MRLAIRRTAQEQNRTTAFKCIGNWPPRFVRNRCIAESRFRGLSCREVGVPPYVRVESPNRSTGPLAGGTDEADLMAALRLPRVSALGCGFNRSMQQFDGIVLRVFHSLVFFLGADSISLLLH